MDSAAYWIEKYKMEAHPEGGHFAEVYRSEGSISGSCLPDRYSSDRSFCTSIYFLLQGQEISSIHRLQGDEIWHFYAGAPLEILGIDPAGIAFSKELGPSPQGDMQVVVPAHAWFGARLIGGAGFALVGCTMAPGFAFEDWELGKRSELIASYPQHASLIKKVTKQ